MAIQAAAKAVPSTRLVGYLLPPYGIYLLWKRRTSTAAAALGTVGLVAYCLLFVAAGVWLLTIAGAAAVDWHGHGRPRLVWGHATRTGGDWKPSGAAVDTNASAYWTDYRGPHRDGRHESCPLRTDWDVAAPRLLWKTDVGGGHSSMSLAHGRLFTMEQWAEGEAITAYNAADGRGLWKHVYAARFNDSYGMGGAGPRSTPTWHEDRVYALGAQGHLHCLDAATGRVLWQKHVLEEHGTRNLMFGLCASPLVVADSVIVTAGARAGAGRNTLIAYHRLTGELQWAAPAENQAYMSPMRVTLAGTEQLLITGARQLMGLSLSNGAVLWSVPWSLSYDNNIAQPLLVDGQRVFISAGYGKGCALLEITASEGQFTATTVWENKHLKNKFTSSVLHEGHIYGLDDSGSDDAAHLVCLDAARGLVQWRGDNFGHGQLLLVAGYLIISCENGDLALVEASPQNPKLIARVPALNGKTWNHPAVADGRLFVRNSHTMSCYDIRPGAAGGVTSRRNAGPEDLLVILAGFSLMNGLGAFLLFGILRFRAPRQ